MEPSLVVEEAGATRLVSSLERAGRVVRLWRAPDSGGAHVVCYERKPQRASLGQPLDFSCVVFRRAQLKISARNVLGRRNFFNVSPANTTRLAAYLVFLLALVRLPTDSLRRRPQSHPLRYHWKACPHANNNTCHVHHETFPCSYSFTPPWTVRIRRKFKVKLEQLRTFTTP